MSLNVVTQQYLNMVISMSAKLKRECVTFYKVNIGSNYDCSVV